jgi:hypothetical protein
MAFIYLKIDNKSFNKYDFCYAGRTKKKSARDDKNPISEEVKSDYVL